MTAKQLPEEALCTAIYAKLNGHITIDGFAVPVFDAVPKNQAYPYIVVNDMITNELDTKLSYGCEVEFYISAWSEYDGQREVARMRQAIVNLLVDGTNLSLGSGFTCYTMPMYASPIERLWDAELQKVTRHGALRMRYLIFQLT